MEEYKVGEPLLETIDLKKYFKLKNGAQLHAVDGINMKDRAKEVQEGWSEIFGKKSKKVAK